MNTKDIRAQYKGNAGENSVSRILSGFNRKQYIVINNVLLKKPFSLKNDIPTVQIDHIVVSIYGIFLIETKNYSGSIYGYEDARTWAVYVGGKKYQMQNPLRQNHAHSKTLQSLLNENASSIGIKNANFSISQIIAFSNKTDIRKVNVTGVDVVHFRDIPNVILRKSQVQCITCEQMEAIAKFINERNIYSPEAMRAHVDSIIRKKSEPVRQKSSWDVSVGNDSNTTNSEYKFEYLPDEKELYIEPRSYNQFNADNKDQKYNNKSSMKWLVITLTITFVVALVLFFCCCGSTLFTDFFSDNVKQNGSISSMSPTTNVITNFSQIDSSLLEELKTTSDGVIDEYIKNNGRDEIKYKDIFENAEYLGCCFGNNEDTENELFFIYKIHNTNEAIDNVNLRKYSGERSIYYYVGYKNISVKKDGTYIYDETIIDEPTKQVPDFTSKSIYSTNNYQFIHQGYFFISDMFVDIENIFNKVEYDPGKEKLLEDNHVEILDITNYSDYFGHSSFIDAGGYVDNSGEEYTTCINVFYHNAFVDPTCVDYRIGTEYQTLTFKYTTNPSLYGDKVVTHISIIDKDSFEVIYDSEDIIKGETDEAVVDITGHENIRIQIVPTEGYVGQVLIKDIVLSN